MARRVKVKVRRVTYTDTSSGVLKHSTVSVPKTPKGPKQVDHSHDVPIPTRGRDFGSPPVTSGTRRTFPTAADLKRDSQQTARAEKLEREREHREEKRAKGQGRVWAAEMLADPMDFLTTPTKPVHGEKPRRKLLLDPGGGFVEEGTGRSFSLAEGRKRRRAEAREAEQDHRDWVAEQRRRRVAAQMVGLSSPRHPVIGDPTKYLVGTMTPERRAEIEGFRHHPGPVRERRTPTKRGDPEAAGFLGRPEKRLQQAGSLFGEIWGDIKDVGTGLYGTPVEYGEALYADLRHPQLTRGPLSRTTSLAARDALGMLGAYERAIPEFPAWLGGDIQVVEHDPDKGFRFVVRDPDATEQGRAAFKESWSRDPLLSALLFVPVATGVTKGVSVGTLRRSIAKANRELSAKEVNQLARRESRMPGYAAGQGYGGGIKPRMVGAPKTTVEPTAGVAYEGTANLARYAEKGEPGYRFHTTKGGSDAVYRDASGTVRGYARATDEGSLKVWVDPDFRRQRIATNLYDTLSRNGVDVDALSGAGPVTREGAAFAGARGKVVGRPYSPSPIGRGVQRGYDFTSDAIERYFGPNVKDLSRLGRTGQLLTGRWATSRRGSRAVERRQRREIAREGAIIARHETTIRRGLGERVRREGSWVTTKPKPEYQQALIAALEAPESISIREAVTLKMQHLKSLETPENRLAIQGQVAELQKSLRGNHLDSPQFEAALDSMVSLSRRAEDLARSVMGMTDEQLLSRRNRIVEAWQQEGLLGADVGDARGWFPHRGINEVVPSSMTPTGVAATGRTVGRPFVTSAVQARKRNRMQLYGRGAVSTDPKVLGNTLRGRVRFAKSEEGRRYLYARGQPIVEGAEIPDSGWYFVRNPDALAKTIPDDVRAIIEDPKRFTEGDEAALRSWANEYIRPSGDGLPLEWSNNLENVRLVPAGNVHTTLGDAFSSAPRGNVASVVGLLNSAVRASLIYLPYGGLRYIVRNVPQNLILQSLTHPSAFKKVVTAVRTARKDRELWDAIVVETGGFPAAAGLPETAIRGVRGAQVAERAVTKGSQRVAGALSTITDEPWRVSGWMQYADSYGFKGPKRYKELLDSDDPNVVRVREDIGQRVKDDLIDFDTLTPTERESVSRYVFIYPFTKGALRWPVTYLRDHQLRTAIIALIASQHEREGAEFGELKVGGEMTALGWLSPISQPQEIIGSAVETVGAAAEGRFDLSAASGILSPTYRGLMEASGRGGLGWKQLGRTWVPGFSTVENVRFRGENVHEQVQRFLGTRPWRFQESTVGKAAEWGKQVAGLYGDVPESLVEAKASKEEFESRTSGKNDRQKVLVLAGMYLTKHPLMADRRKGWTAMILDADADGLDDWRGTFERELGWEGVRGVDSRLEVIDDLDDYFKTHPEDEHLRELWEKDIASSNDERLSGWRKTLAAG